jgi:hypothetical protein
MFIEIVLTNYFNIFAMAQPSVDYVRSELFR